MLKAIQKYLTSDSELVSLVGYTDKNQRIKEYFPKDRNDYPFIIFEAYPSLAGDIEALTEYKLDLTILSKDVLNVEAITKRLLDLLHYQKDGFRIDDTILYFSKHIGGNGINYDPDQELFEQILSFQLKGN